MPIEQSVVLPFDRSRERIDAHHHLWDRSVFSQDWTADIPVLNRDFVVADLLPVAEAAGVTGTVLVETVNIPGETAEFLAIAARNPIIRGVVGWVDLTSGQVAEDIAALRSLPGGDRLVGLRHQVQLEADDAWLTRPDVLAGLSAVADAGLVFEILTTRHQLPAAIEAVRATPHGRFVLDHMSKPDIASGELSPWREHIQELAGFANVACKLSGMVTEASADWTVDDLRPYADVVLGSFGPERVMAGSDWPVCLMAADYVEVWKAAEELVAGFDEEDVSRVMAGTATEWYGLR